MSRTIRELGNNSNQFFRGRELWLKVKEHFSDYDPRNLIQVARDMPEELIKMLPGQGEQMFKDLKYYLDMTEHKRTGQKVEEESR